MYLSLYIIFNHIIMLQLKLSISAHIDTGYSETVQYVTVVIETRLGTNDIIFFNVLQ
jgi:hypothetical protein